MESEVITISDSTEHENLSPQKVLPKRKRRVHSLQISITRESSTSDSESADEKDDAPPRKKLRQRISVSYCDVNSEVVDAVSDGEKKSDSDESFAVKKKSRKKKVLDSDDEYVPEEKPVAKRRKLTGADEEGATTKPTAKVKAQKKPAVKKERTVVKKEKVVKPKTERKPRAPRKGKLAAAPSEIVPGEDGVKVEASTSKDVKVKIETQAQMDWDEAEYLAELQRLDGWVAANVKRLFDEDNTIPFIARYRKEMTGDMSPEKLRLVKESYEMIKTVKHKAATTMLSIDRLGKLTPDVERSLRCARTLSEIEYINAPFKVGSKRSLAERARELGLEPASTELLEGHGFVNLHRYVQADQKGLESLDEVRQAAMHIMADVISKDKLVLEQVRKLKDEATNIELEVTKAKVVKAAEKKKVKEVAKPVNVEKPGTVKKKMLAKTIEEEQHKFQSYFNFRMRVRHIRPHQVLAINRGESLKILSVKVVIPDWLSNRLCNFCFSQWFSRGLKYPLRQQMLNESIQDCYARLLQPLMVRQVRADLNEEAQRASIEVFAANLKHLLLQHPLKGKTILGIDPGFRMGCKLGVISATGEVLATDVIYPHCGKRLEPPYDPNACKLKELLHKHTCELVALGNGTACRESEDFLSGLIQSGWFAPLDVSYTIVSEQGASIYSCSPAAKKEFPSMDPNLISAVSLARRVQDPLGELVKVEPKHLGVGMYQHDVSPKQLSTTLDEVVMECVSFVGVDINTASDILLRRIAGLNSLRATKIVEWRAQNGPFHNREQIKKVKGIGGKSYEQCAGFVRILPETWASLGNFSSASNSGDVNPLDRTWIHPESYMVALRFISLCGADVADVGKPYFISRVQRIVQERGLPRLASELGVREELMKLISDGLQQLPGYDIRVDGKPLFRRGLTSLEDLENGTVLTGRVQNVTHFGSFVDIGVGTDGLIPISQLRGMDPPLGSHVEVRVMSVNIPQKRVSLSLIRVLT